MQQNTAVTTLAGLYSQYEGDRQPYLDRARDCSKYTIPSLLPPHGTTGATKLKTPYQGLGARLVNNLAAKLLLAILPANTPFFKLSIDEMTMRRIATQAGQKEAIQEGLAKSERTVQQRMEASPLRSKLSEGLKHLLVAGNVLLFVDDTSKVRVFKLDSYVVRRDALGNILEIVTKESISPLLLSPEVISACDVATNTREDVTVYTGVFRTSKGFQVYQEINEKVVPESQGTFPEDKLPFMALRFFAIDGEHYGRGYVEEYQGDLQSLEGLCKAIVQGSAAAAKVVFLVKNSGGTDRRSLAKAANGDFVDGDPNDVQALQLQKFNDFRVAQETIRDISERLSYAFLLNAAVQRSGERVTAEEIRFLARELEDGLGGIYSILSQELQLPLVNVLMARMIKAKVIPPLPKKIVKVSITTGLEALGRGQDADRLKLFLADVGALGPEAFANVKMDALLSRLAVARGIDTEGLIKTPEELAAEQQQAMMAQMMQQGGQAAIPEIAKAVIAQGGAATQ